MSRPDEGAAGERVEPDPGFYVGDTARSPGDPDPDGAAGFVRHGRYEVLFASVIGRSHIEARTRPSGGKRYREDAVAIAARGPWLVAALSDGVGSAANARYGATLCVESAVLCCLEALDCGSVSLGAPLRNTLDAGQLLWEAAPSGWGRPLLPPAPARELVGSFPESALAPNKALIENAVETAFEQTHDRFQKMENPRRMACTLHLIALHSETGQMGVGYLGDGLMTGAWSFAQRELVAHKTTGEADTVCPITDAGWDKYASYQWISPQIGGTLGAMHVMSDGVADDCMGELRFPPWARRMEERYRKPTPVAERCYELGLTLRDESISQDDLSVILLFRLPPNKVAQTTARKEAIHAG
ncbi:MAG TPA: protein phosphatase 2C domain-containing protein [Chthonomonadaceae bacterium]|nr:protein phosphatase 2C domain-containing protein [Chthonomonadaceae bacterium]